MEKIQNRICPICLNKTINGRFPHWPDIKNPKSPAASSRVSEERLECPLCGAFITKPLDLEPLVLS